MERPTCICIYRAPGHSCCSTQKNTSKQEGSLSTRRPSSFRNHSLRFVPNYAKILPGHELFRDYYLGLASTGLPPLPTEAPLSRVAPTPAIDATEDSSASPFSSDALRKDTLENLERVMSHCLENMEKRKKDDVKKRLDLLWSAWEQGKLSTVVQQKTQELTSGELAKF